MVKISSLIDAVLRRVKIISESEYKINETFKKESREKVKKLCNNFPIR